MTASRHVARERERPRVSYYYQDKQVCVKMFRILHTIGEKRLKNLMKSLKAHGLTPRIHGNTKRKPHHALSFSSIEYVVRFLLNYMEQNGLLLPGRVPGYSRTDIKLLPSSVSKRGIWRVYHVAAEEDETVHTVAYSTFCKLWKTCIVAFSCDHEASVIRIVQLFFGQQIVQRRRRRLSSGKHRNICVLSTLKGHTIRRHVMNVRLQLKCTSPPMVSSLHHHHSQL